MLNRLDTDLRAAGIPIDGVSGAQGAIRVDYRPDATAQQRASGAAIVAAFDWSPAAHATWLDEQAPERTTLRQQAAQAVADIDAYLALSTPTNAQNAAQIRRLSQICRALIRRLVQLD